ncbi:MAG: T9SS type A sorting domain-containing protein, partial [Candidatus Kapaibacterium sp.]
EPSDIEFNKNNTIIGVSKSASCCRYIKIFDLQSQTLLYQYNIGSWNQFNFSNNELYFISSISGFLSLYPKHWVLSNILSNNQGNHNFTLSPNPTTNRLNINLNSNGFEYTRLSIVDILGNEVGLIEEGLMNTSNYQKEYDVSDLPPSIYFIRLEIGNEVVTKKFIKE